MAKNLDLYKKRYKTLKEHRAAVAARKLLKGGNKGPVANADAYGETLKKAEPKTTTKKSVKPIPKPAEVKPSTPAKPSTPSKPKASDKAVEGGYTISKKNRKPKKDSKPVIQRQSPTAGSRAQPTPATKTRQQQQREGARRVSEKARKMNPNPSSMSMYPLKNPYKGHRYKKPFGPIMVYNGEKYVRADGLSK